MYIMVDNIGRDLTRIVSIAHNISRLRKRLKGIYIEDEKYVDRWINEVPKSIEALVKLPSKPLLNHKFANYITENHPAIVEMLVKNGNHGKLLEILKEIKLFESTLNNAEKTSRKKSLNKRQSVRIFKDCYELTELIRLDIEDYCDVDGVVVYCTKSGTTPYCIDRMIISYSSDAEHKDFNLTRAQCRAVNVIFPARVSIFYH